MSDLRKKDVRETIIKVAQDIFSRIGFKKTTMNEIAEAARKAKSSVYHYFDSKEEIFKVIIEKESLLLRAEITKAIGKEETPQNKIKTYIITRMTTIHQLANYYSAIKDEYLENYGFIEKLREEYDKEEVIMIKRILKQGVEEGVFVVNDLDSLSAVFIVALKGLEFQWIKEKDVTKTIKRIDDIVKVLLYGIMKK